MAFRSTDTQAALGRLKGYGYTAGGVTLGKWGDRSQYGDLKVVIEGI